MAAHAENDPTSRRLESLAAHLKPAFNGDLFAIAYNDSCAPTVEERWKLDCRGSRHIRVCRQCSRPGDPFGTEFLRPWRLRSKHPEIALRYSWPFDSAVASMLAAN